MYCCRKIIRFYKVGKVVPSPSLAIFFGSSHRHIDRDVIRRTRRIVSSKRSVANIESAHLTCWRL